MHFRYQKDLGFSFEKLSSMEWLETNGLGGYASSTVINCHTRKYHGLLVSALDSLPDKYVLLNKIEDVFVQDGKENLLTAHLYPNFLQDGSLANFQEFKLTTHPTWIFKFDSLVLTKEILMLQEENTVLLKYSVSGDSNFKIVLRPLLSCRNFHNLQRENSSLQYNFEGLSDGFCCSPYKDMPQMFFQTNVKHSFLSQPLWYRNFIYPREKERGYDFQEDLYSPGAMIFEFGSGREIIFACSVEKQKSDLLYKWKKELDGRDKKKSVVTDNEFQKQLQQVGQTFITKKIADKQTRSVVAGYHWFLDWGRDAMISLPGLTLYSGQEDVCLSILKNFANNECQGLIPNFLGTNKETNAYNTVDASLWFVWAVQQYYLKTKNLKEIAASFWATLKNIFEFYKNGTLYNIKMQENGLLFAGSREVNLTWMDAVVDDMPVTPRYGCQVEVNALWFNMLSFMDELASQMQDSLKQELQLLLKKIKKSFCQTFWCEEKGYLYDFVNGDQKNSALRPNQIFAVSLPYSPLLIKMAVSVMTNVREHLLTPYGLRTLAQNETGYIGFYNGNQAKRDSAYHNGTVWPWLLGHFTEALLKVTSDRRKVVAIIEPCLEALQKHLSEYGIGSIAEIFSGDSPHQPNGCISQAWSVAEVLRLTYLLNMDK